MGFVCYTRTRMGFFGIVVTNATDASIKTFASMRFTYALTGYCYNRNIGTVRANHSQERTKRLRQHCGSGARLLGHIWEEERSQGAQDQLEQEYKFLSPGEWRDPITSQKAMEKLEMMPGFLHFLQSVGLIIHEFLHVLGAIHEHNRPDRFRHVQIKWDNIVSSQVHNFWIASWKGQHKFPTRCRNLRRPNYRYCVSDHDLQRMDDLPYDLDSIMHYPPTL